MCQAVSAVFPSALFCTFRVTDDSRKIPHHKLGVGVSAETPAHLLYTSDELDTDLPDGHYWGVVMHHDVYDCFDEGVLTILDVDMKRSDAPTDIRITRLAKWANANGHLSERSHSTKGRHVVFIAKRDERLPPKIALSAKQEIEIFGQPNSPGKSVMLTDDMLSQDEVSSTVVDLFEVLQELSIQPDELPIEKAKPQPDIYQRLTSTPDIDRASSALEHISPDIDYADWIMIGQALHTEFGGQGLQLWNEWSMAGSKYKGDKDIDTHWKSFHAGKGVSMGTLYHMAKQNGWTPPTPKTERKSAIEDFMQRNEVTQVTQVATETDEAAPTPEPANDGWDEMDYDLDHLPAIRYIIDGFLAHGMWVIAGQPGVGKTTVLMSLMLIIIQSIKDAEVTASTPRKVILVTEDADQIIRGLYGYAKHLNLDPRHITTNIVLIRAKRAALPELLLLESNVVKHTLPDGTRPFLILDTANATLDLENENDNSEVGSYMNGLKQTIYTLLDTPIGIVSHMNKMVSRQDSEASARGASAFTGDSTGTAVIFSDEDGARYMRLVKRRYEPIYDEIEFSTHTFTALATSKEGEMVETVCRVMTPHVSSQELRQQKDAERTQERQSQRSIDRADEACAYVQSVINSHPNGVVIRRGKNPPKNPPSDMTHCYRLDAAEIHAAVKGSSRGDVKQAVMAAIFQRFAPESMTNEWVRLG